MSLPTPSGTLSPAAAEHFATFARELWKDGMDDADRLMIEDLAVVQATIADCDEEIARDGRFVDVLRGGYNGSNERVLREENRAVMIRERAVEQKMKLLKAMRERAAEAAGNTTTPSIPGLDEVARKREELARQTQ